MGQYNTYCGRIVLPANLMAHKLAAVKCMATHEYPKDPEHPAYWFFNHHATIPDAMGSALVTIPQLKRVVELVDLPDGGWELRFCVCNKQDIDVYQGLVDALTSFIPGGSPNGTLQVVCIPEEWMHDKESDKAHYVEYTWLAIRKGEPMERVINVDEPWNYYYDDNWFEPFMA